MPNLVKSINLTDDDKATLEGILRQSTVEARTYIRAKILLLKSECRSNEAIADKLDICVTAVRLCLDKYNAGGIEAALQDNKGRGRKAEITDSDITWVINKACQKPKDFGYSAELWYPASFSRFINSIAEQEGHPRMASVTETTLQGAFESRLSEVLFSCLFPGGIKERERGEAMKKEEFTALGISEELAAKAEAASLKELEGYAAKEQLDAANAENKALKQSVVIRRIIWSRFRQFIWMCSQVQTA